MRFLIAGLLLVAPVAVGCAGGGSASREGVEEQGVALRGCLLGGPTGAKEASSEPVPSCFQQAADIARLLPAAGGGRPRTGYVGLGAALYFASDNSRLSGGWGLDLNYVQNVTGNFSVEGSLGTVNYDLEIESAGKGDLGALTLGVVAQYGRPFGTSRWYVGAGGGYWLNEARGMGDLDADDAAAWIVEGGVQFSLSGRADLDLEFRYTFAECGLSNGQDYDLTLDAFAARVNWVFVF